MDRHNGGRQRGFTLVELSVVLVIIGLLVGGVLVGQDMINSARLKSVTRDFNAITSATNMFRARYNAYPGDIPNATSYNLGNNGNGNGQIGGFPSTDFGEMWLFWQHLANAKMWKGNFTGTGTLRQAVLGVNVPRSAIDNAGYTVTYWNGYTDSSDWTNPAVGATIASHVVMFGASDQNTYETYNPAITPSDARAVDLKIDDGLPAKGKIIMMGPAYLALSNCTTSSNAATAEYRITNKNIACGILYLAF